jgi:hypothetical protein
MGRRARFGAAVVTAAMLLCLVAAPASAAGRVRWVARDGRAGPTGCDGHRAARTSIQAAIDASGPGDTVIVCDGTYREGLTISADRAGLTLKAAHPGRAILRMPATGFQTMLRIDGAARVTISGLALRADTDAPCTRAAVGVGIVAGAVGVVLDRLSIAPRGTDTMGACGIETAVMLLDGSRGLLRRSTLVDFRDLGAWVSGDGSRLTVKDTTLRFLHATVPAGTDCTGSGIVAIHGGTARLRSSRVLGRSTAGITTPCLVEAFVGEEADATEVSGTTIRYVRVGVLLYRGSGHVVSANHITDGRAPADQPGSGVVAKDVASSAIGYNVIARMGSAGVSLIGTTNLVTVRGNTLQGNGLIDCLDTSSGPNVWTGNTGDESSPAGLCAHP